MTQCCYDALGNIRARSLGSHGVTLDYDGKPRLTQVTSTMTGTRDVSYDNRGNITSLGGQDFTYDSADQPISLSGTASGSYVYDGNFRRVKSTVGGETIYNIYDAAGTLAYVDNATTGKKTEYVRAGSTLIARVTNGIDTYIHTDHLGSPVAGTSASGGYLWREVFTPFGMSMDSSANYATPTANHDISGFTGHIRDSATGLTYMQQRYYEPEIGRFLSIDPVTFMQTGNPAMFNRYAYTFNDPINMIDPTGEAGCSVYICGSITTNSDGYVTVRSSPILRSVVPGQVAWDNARTSHANGDTVGAVVGTAAMVGEQVLTVATLGAGTAATQTARVATTQATQKAAPTVTRELTKSQQKSINTLQKRITEHTQKLDDFIANPTVRPGMEGQPASVIKAAQDSRIGHLKKEISTFKNNIRKIEEGLD